jgi:uncharacterized repeat protein (TIGR01451 family)
MATVEVSPNPAQGGERGLATVRVSNPSDTRVDDVRVDLQIPDFVDALGTDDYSPGGSCSGSCGAGDTITWLLGSLEAGEVVTLLVFPTIALNVPAGTTLVFALTVSAPEEPMVQRTAATKQGERALAVRLEPSASKVEPGEEVTYAVHYANQSGGTLQNVVVILVLPPGTELVIASSGGALMPDGSVEWTFVELAPGQGGTVSGTVTVDPALPEGAQLEAKAEGEVDGQRTLATTHTVLSEKPLVSSTQVSPDKVTAGERIMVGVTTSNRSLATLEDVEVSVRMPQGLETVPSSELSPGGSCAGAGCRAGDLATWSVGDLVAGESVTVSVVPLVASDVENGAFLTFEVLVTVNGEPALQTNATAIEGERLLELRLDESDNPVERGDALTYTLHVANPHTSTVDGTAAIRVPSGTTFLNASDDGSVNADGVVEWPLAQLFPGKGATRQLEVRVDPALPLGSQLRADATALVTGSNDEARATRHTPVTATALQASIVATPDPIAPGQAGLVSVLVSNPSGAPVDNVVVDVSIPQNLEAIPETQLSPGGSCTGADSECTDGERATWSLGTLGAAESRTVSLPLPVSPGVADGTLITFEAEVTAGGEVPARSSATTRVDAQRPLSLVVEDGGYPVAPGATLVYVVHYSNQSGSTVDGTVTLTIPDGASFESASDGGALNTDGEAQWVIVQLVPGDSESRMLAVKVDDELTEGSQVLTFATATVDGGDRVRATEHTPVGQSPLAVAVEATPDSLESGKTLLVAATVTNTSGSTVDDIDVFLSIPQGLAPVMDADLSIGGSCPNTSCTAFEQATWSVGSLTAGQSSMVSFAATVASSTMAGTLMPFVAEVTAAAKPLAGASATASVCSGPTCPPAPGYIFLAGSVNQSITLDAGQPNATTITSVAGAQHGSSSGYSAWVGAYDSSYQLAWAASISAGNAAGNGFVKWGSGARDEAGNGYATIQAGIYPGTLTLRSADGTTIEHTPTVDSGVKHYGVAKIDRDGIWQWYAPIEAEAGSGGSAYIKPASTSVYGGRVYVTAEHGITDTGRTVRISDQTGVSFTREGALVHPVIILDATTGAYIDHRITNSPTTAALYAVMRHNHLIPIAPNQWQESFTVPTVGSVGPSGWYDGSTGFYRKAIDIAVNANDGQILLAGAVQAGVLVRRDLDGNADWAYVVAHGGGNTGFHNGSTIGAALETGDGVIFLGGVDMVMPEFNSAGGVITWSASTSISSKNQYLARYAEDGNIRWLTHVNAGNAAGFGLTAGRPENRSVLHDPVADRVYAAYAMPPWPDMGISDAQGAFYKDYNDPLLFGAGEATEETFAHSGDDGLIVLAAFDGVDGSFLWATSHRRADTQIFQPGSKGIFLNEAGEVVMLLISRAGTTTYGDNKTPVSIPYSTESMVAVRHSVADGSVLGVITVDNLGSSSGNQTFFNGVYAKSQ